MFLFCVGTDRWDYPPLLTKPPPPQWNVFPRPGYPRKPFQIPTSNRSQRASESLFYNVVAWFGFCVSVPCRLRDCLGLLCVAMDHVVCACSVGMLSRVALVELWFVFGLNVLKRFGLNCVRTREGSEGAIPPPSHPYQCIAFQPLRTFILIRVSLLRWYVLPCV